MNKWLKKICFISALFTSIFLINGCAPGPGELEGTWKMDGLVPMTVIYSSNKEEAMGIISEVSYEHEGNSVLISYESGLAEGNAIRLTKIDKDTYRSEFGLLRRVN